MRVVVIGSTGFTLACAHAAYATAELVGLVGIPAHARPLNSRDLSAFSADRRVPHAEFADLDTGDALAWLRARAPDWIVSSWPRILGPEVLAIPRYGVIGSHPTRLPHNRGRHPLHWSIALGLREVCLSFFRMDGGLDSGAVLRRAPIQLHAEDDIASLTLRVDAAAEATLAELLVELATDPLRPGEPQDEAQASAWRKRSPHDSLLDWRIGVADLVRIVRSFAPPFPCARLVWREGLLPVARAEPSALPQRPRVGELEPGRIVCVEAEALHVKAGDGVVRVGLAVPCPDALRAGDCLHPPSYYLLGDPQRYCELHP